MESTIEKITWSEVCEAMRSFNEARGYTSKGNKLQLEAVVVFTEDSFGAPYTEKERSYLFTSDNKAFLPNQSSNSMFADCLDDKDLGVRIDWYMHDEKAPWKVDYCYLLEKCIYI